MLWRIGRDADASYKRIHAPSTSRGMLIAVRGDICDAFVTNQQEYARFVTLSAGSACRPVAERWSLRPGGRPEWSALAARRHRCVLWRGCRVRMLRRPPALRASGSRAALRCVGCLLRSGLPSFAALPAAKVATADNCRRTAGDCKSPDSPSRASGAPGFRRLGHLPSPCAKFITNC